MQQSKSRATTVFPGTCPSFSASSVILFKKWISVYSGASVLHAGSVTFVAGFSPVVEVNRIVTHLPGSFLDFSNDSDILNDVDSALSSFKKVDYRAILKGGERLQKLTP